MTDQGGDGLSLAEAVFGFRSLITRLDESQSRNPAEVLKSPASDLIVAQIKDVMHFIPERNPVFNILRGYITDDRSTSGEMRVVDVLPMLEMLTDALATEYERRRRITEEKQGGVSLEGPKGGIEMHHRRQPRLPRGTAYRPESPSGDQNEMTWLRPPRRP
jgi:hypothetical protein